MTNAEKISKELCTEYNLTYRCGVNLEGVANKLIEKFSKEEAKSILDDVISNLESI